MKNFFSRLGLPLLALLLAGAPCTSPGRIQALPTPTEGLPVPSPSPTPQYVTFTHGYKTLFELTFDYPAEWKEQYYEGEGEASAQLNLFDPTKLPPDVDMNSAVNADNFIVIDVLLGDKRELREFVERGLNVERKLASGEKETPECVGCISPFPDEEIIDNIILEDRVTEIAGYPAYFISTQATRVEGETRKTFFGRSVYILAEDRLYSFTLHMLADEKEGPFGQGFEYLISTLRPYSGD